jgi:signal transduction histidine kinase
VPANYPHVVNSVRIQQQQSLDGPLDASTGVSEQNGILAQQLGLVRAAMPAALIAQIGMIAGCVIVFWPLPAFGTIALWAAIALLAIIGRALLLWMWPHGPLTPSQTCRLLRVLLGAAVITGAIWGSLPALIQHRAPIEHQMFLGVVLAGMCAGALAALGYIRVVFYAFILPALLPFITVMLTSEGAIQPILGLLALLFLGSLAFIARTLERVVVSAFSVQHANADLVRRLTAARDLASSAAEAKNALIASLEESRREAESANQAKSTFLAIMSHELRTPLNAIIGFADVMRTEALGPLQNERYREYVNDIRESGTHLLELINKILDLSKIEAGKFDLALEPLAVEQTVRSVLRLFREQATVAGVALELKVEPNAAVIHADTRSFKQMLINLISNAVKFAPRGTMIRITAAVKSGWVELCVCDQGIGIPPSDIDKAIAPFSQLGDPMTRRHDGTGLGLSLVKALIELHGGHLSIEPTPGGGTTVRLHFPEPPAQLQSGEAEVQADEHKSAAKPIAC